MASEIREQIETIFRRDPAARSVLEIALCYPGFHAILLHRIAHRLYRGGWYTLARIFSQFSRSVTGIDIHPGATIGERFFIDHGTGVVIGETTEIAENVRLYQGVTLGAVNFPRDSEGNIIRGRKRHPTIEEGVVIFSNASVLGGDTVIGANSMIGAGVTIMSKKIPPNTLVTVEKPNLRFREAS